MPTPDLRLYVGDLEYVLVEAYAKVDGEFIDPTADTVQMAFTEDDAVPVSGDWKTASWEAAPGPIRTEYFARCLVGTTGTSGGAITLDAGTYRIWVHITDNPERPMKRSSRLVVVG